ncbi:hypothetical protein [Demequina activiva]|uniref:Uncharacterized protein n=1 Tax=Demequina activiva TaxID=1582364 RepID=A0A919Q488_9MICO|nr:hypothetical protein [Demequina activiva]GIG55274.1 hypothetical protein Dac01nite_20260 [Demequina activiva]
MADIPGSDRLHALAVLALDHAVASMAGGALTPFAVEEDGAGKRTLTPFPNPNGDEGVVHARGHVHGSSAARVAVCFAGPIALEEGRFDAVWAMVQEPGLEASVAFYQRYETADATAQPVGNPGYAGEADPLL